MAPIIGIPTTRISDIFLRERLLSQVQHDQLQIYKSQLQLSTGQRFQAPSEDPVAAMRVISLQRLLERKAQVQTNLVTNQSYLSATDTALSNVSAIVAEVRGVALEALGTTNTPEQRMAAAQQVDQALRQLFDTGNERFRGRHLFAGANTQLRPFLMADDRVEYLGDEKRLASYADIDLLFDSNVNGHEVFGGLSAAVRGSVDLNPVMTAETRLWELHGGQGISRGSLAISDGVSTSIVDLSGAETIGDVAALIRARPPDGRRVDVEITPVGLKIALDDAEGNLTIREVSAGTTAKDLGILREVGIGNVPVEGTDLNPVLRNTTLLDDCFGVRARTVVRSAGPDSDFIVEAQLRGGEWNGFSVQFAVDDPPIAPGNEYVSYDEDARSITVHVAAGQTRARDVVAAINDAGIPFTARLDPLDAVDDGRGFIDPAAHGETAWGAGEEFDQDSGVSVQNAGGWQTVSFAAAERVEDLLNLLNDAGIGLKAKINDQGNGIDVRSRASGVDFSVGENGGTTAAQLGLRTFTEETLLADLDYGRGVPDYAEGTDFTITRSDGVSFEIDVSGARTVGDVIRRIDEHPVNNEPGGVPLSARLAVAGNGIELVDESGGPGEVTVTRHMLSTAAIALGLIAPGEETSAPHHPGAVAQATVPSAGENNDLIFRALGHGTEWNGVQIVFEDAEGGEESSLFDQGAGRLVFRFDAPKTANEIIDMLASSGAGAHFTAELDPTHANDGTGEVDFGDPKGTMAGGAPAVLTGRDVNPQEVDGVFTALLRLRAALQQEDVREIQRAIDLLDDAALNLTFVRAEVGSRQQGLDVMQRRLEDEELVLREVLSVEFDADLVKVVSDLAGRQAAYEASLRASATIFQMTLLNYL